MDNPQSTLLIKSYVNPTSVFLPEEIVALELVSNHLVEALPSTGNPFIIGIGTRHLVSVDSRPQLELVLNHARFSSPKDQPNFYQDECQRVLQIATRPREYFDYWPKKVQEYCDPHEDALKNGVMIYGDRMAVGSLKDKNGWFVIGIRFGHVQVASDNDFAAAFLAGIAKTIFAMDEHNNCLKAAMESHWDKTIDPLGEQLDTWLSKSNLPAFETDRYEHKGPRNFFG